jgi:hypothetical protein
MTDWGAAEQLWIMCNGALPIIAPKLRNPPFYQQPEADREDIHRDQLIQKSTRYGDRAGQQVRRIGSGFASELELLEKLSALVPPPRVQPVR